MLTVLYRIPKSALLNRYADIIEGKYVQKVKGRCVISCALHFFSIASAFILFTSFSLPIPPCSYSDIIYHLLYCFAFIDMHMPF